MLHSVKVRPGDIITTSGTGFGSAGINVVTGGVPGWCASHVGIIARYNQQNILFESTSVLSDKCLIRGEVVSGVQAHSIDSLLERSGRIWLHRLHRRLFHEEEIRLTLFLVDLIGRKYDFLGAGRSGVGGPLFRRALSVLKPGDLKNIYCSELVSAALNDIGIWSKTEHSIAPNPLIYSLRWRGLISRRERLK